MQAASEIRTASAKTYVTLDRRPRLLLMEAGVDTVEFGGRRATVCLPARAPCTQGCTAQSDLSHGVPDGESLAGAAVDEQPPAGRAVQARVAHQRCLLCRVLVACAGTRLVRPLVEWRNHHLDLAAHATKRSEVCTSTLALTGAQEGSTLEIRRHVDRWNTLTSSAPL